MTKYKLENKKKCEISDIISISIYVDSTISISTSGIKDFDLFNVIEDLYFQLQEKNLYYDPHTKLIR